MKKLDAPSAFETRRRRQTVFCPASGHALPSTLKNPLAFAGGIAGRPACVAATRTIFLISNTGSAAHQRTASAPVVRGIGSTAPDGGSRFIQPADLNLRSRPRRVSLGSWLLAAWIFLALIASQTARAIEPIRIVTQPQSQTATVGGEASFSVTVTGDDPIYEWWSNGMRIPGGTNAVCTLDNVQSADAGNYQVAVFNDAVWIASVVVTLTVVSPPAISAIPDQSTDQNTTLGPLNFTTTGGSAQPGSLTLTASSSDTNLVPNQSIFFGGTGTNRTITIVPGTNRFGACEITLSVSGANGAVARTTFALVVNHLNQPPGLAEEPHLVVKPFEPFSHVFVVRDPDPGDYVQVWAYGLPEWASYDSGTRTLSGVSPLGDPAGTLITLGISDGVTPTQWRYFWIWTEDTIGFADAVDVERKRGVLINYIWGEQGWPTGDQFAAIETNITDQVYSSLYNEQGNLLRIDRYTVRMDYGLESRVHHFHPIQSNGRLFLFHAGHHPAGFEGDDVWVNNAGQYPGLVIPRLLKEGYSVLAFDMPIYNPGGPPVVTLPDGRQITLDVHWNILSNLEKPFRFFLEPIVVALNYVQEHYDYRNVYMTGLSGGGWTTTIYAALDPRIERSFPVAGSVPIYLRKGAFEAEQEYAPFYRLANYEELYVMGAHGFNRLQTQILNRYDACCFSGTNSSYWVEEVKQATRSLGEGTYEFVLDESHQEHKTSLVGLGVILDSLPPSFAEIPDRTIAGNAGPQTVPLSGITSALLSRTNAMFITAGTDKPELVANLTINYTNPNPSGALSFTTQPGAYGSAIVTVTISDGQSDRSTFSRRFAVTVLPPNQLPLVQWVSPTNESILQKPQPVTLQAAASDLDGTIVRVEFRDGTNSLGVVSNPPYSLLWSNPTVGTHTLSAVATDDRGSATASATALLTVLPLNQAPIVQWLGPTNESILQKPQPVTLQAAASDLDGTIVRVEFRDGTNSLGVVSNPPYSLLWSNPTVGTHTLSAVATDNRGGATTSDTALLTVLPLNQAPIVQWLGPTNESILQKPQPVTLQAAASDLDGTIVRVEFRDGTNSLGMVSNPPYSLLWSNPTVGTHTLSAVATDDRMGATTSDTALLTVLPLNQAPIVQWLGPANESILQKSQPVTLQAAASDLDGTIVRVEFRDGTNSLGVVSTPPYSLLWSQPTVGTHTLSAVATDNRGGTATSETALLTVLPLNQAPIVKWLGPTNESILQKPQPVTLQAAASDLDGTIVRVEFRDGTNSLGVVSTPPYSLLWSNPTVGRHTLRAVATDDRGGATTSDAARLTVLPPNQLPLVQWVSPTNGLMLDGPRPVTLEVLANDPDGTVVKVEFRDGTNSLGVVSNPPYSLLWSNATVGTHTLSVVAADDREGAASSDLITVTVAATPTNAVPLTIQSAQFVAIQAPPVSKSAIDFANSQFQIQIAGPDGSLVVVEASTDFSNWAPISTNTLVNGSVVRADADSRNFKIRLYRARLATQAP